MKRREFLRFLAALALFFRSNPAFSSDFRKKDAAEPDSDKIKALYLTNNAAVSQNERSRKIRESITQIADETEINGLVIDALVDFPLLSARLESFLQEMKKRKLYLIARLVVCQNSQFALKHPDLALKKRDGSLWHSGKKEWRRFWIDPAAEKLWDFVLKTSADAAKIGFDEVQYDYIRFPSDGNMSDIVFPLYRPGTSQRKVMRRMFEFLADGIRSLDKKTKISVDIFGEGALPEYAAKADKEIGQHLFDVAELFDYISPMVYPSHYAPGFMGFAVPAKHPYETVFLGLKKAKEYLDGKNLRAKLRPYLQDFSVKNYRTSVYVPYDAEMVKAQMRAAEDLNIGGWILWNAANRYTKEALKPKIKRPV